ncbi:hypothetical protein [Mycolicibacter hiberniae]|uniref:Uncharacterized protein n=1 Tax=Mycolicibacter hiberniae TaxID=29314 RepID=A0A7I7X3R6_9MYCO|nr:hypothetical protein [Mycolicibacter hiberniae]MCV7086137.1 hypothetical protein [Mycolicibacter hiberniae]ORV70689.1 hypothetical protein AWC09_09650 [Mycolicibacter hiberniae]BBZ24254.1 hypothetical protein MHIB_26720 [Mycolicibacter hiberniae]
MAARFDVPARLAQGREAVAVTQAYVSACHRRGYRDAELTGYDGQLADRYDSEAGLDLRALDSDCTELRALADAADDALHTQRRHLAALQDAWRGPGADAAAEFLRRHCDTAAALTDRLRAAATGLGVLRDELWRLVDVKVAAVLGVDERVGAQRPAWLSAACAVNAGTADERAVDIVEKQVLAYVDNDVRGDWVAAVRAAQDGIAEAYRTAIAAAGAGPAVWFAVPADLGPIPRPEGPETVPVADDGGRPAAAVVAASDDPAQPLRPAAPQPPHPGPPFDGGAPGTPGAFEPPGTRAVPGDWGWQSAGPPSGTGGGLGGLPGLPGLGGLIPGTADTFGADEPFRDPFEDRPRAEAEHSEPAGVADSEGSPDPDEAADAEPESDPAESPADRDDPQDRPGNAPLGDAAGEAAPSGGNREPEAPSAGTDAEQPLAASDVAPQTPCDIAAQELPHAGG